MWQAMVMLAWLIGTGFGALWASSLERQANESARRYGLYMAYFYLAGIVLAGFSVVPAGWWTALVGFFVAAFFAVIVVLDRRRLRR